jgi:hypothetical protein
MIVTKSSWQPQAFFNQQTETKQSLSTQLGHAIQAGIIFVDLNGRISRLSCGDSAHGFALIRTDLEDQFTARNEQVASLFKDQPQAVEAVQAAV